MIELEMHLANDPNDSKCNHLFSDVVGPLNWLTHALRRFTEIEYVTYREFWLKLPEEFYDRKNPHIRGAHFWGGESEMAQLLIFLSLQSCFKRFCFEGFLCDNDRAACELLLHDAFDCGFSEDDPNYTNITLLIASGLGSTHNFLSANGQEAGAVLSGITKEIKGIASFEESMRGRENVFFSVM